MRILLATAMLLLSVAALAAPANAREVACADVVRDSCPGYYCLDSNLNGRFDGGECMVIYCVENCCGAPCPPLEP